jgi:ketosteroid isomerase-like protein
MATQQRAYELFEHGYYGHIDRCDMAGAAAALHPDIEWSHQQVWAHHEFARGAPQELRGREAVRDYLAARVQQLREARIRHHVREMVFDAARERGAFLGAVDGPDGRSLPFMVWFELRDDLVRKYVLRPL